MDKRFLLTIFLGGAFVLVAFEYHILSYFIFGVLISLGVVIISLLVSYFIKKDNSYYDRNT